MSAHIHVLRNIQTGQGGLASGPKAGRPEILDPLTCPKLHGGHCIAIPKKVQDGWTTTALRRETRKKAPVMCLQTVACLFLVVQTDDSALRGWSYKIFVLHM